MIVDAARAAELLEAGRVVAYPTETVMGLGVDAHSSDALERLGELKGTDAGRGFSILLADPADLEALAPDAPPLALALAREFWPGPLTLVIGLADPSLAAVATARGVGLRCSPHPAARELALLARVAVVSTSCNKSGEAPCRSGEEAERVFGSELPVLAGVPGGLEPSSVVAVGAGGELEILREGSLSREALHAARATWLGGQQP